MLWIPSVKRDDYNDTKRRCRLMATEAMGALRQQDTRRIYHPIQKDYATFLETSEETGGERTLIEIEVAPGGGTTPHYHLTYSEHFEVISGALEVMVGGITRTLTAGQKAVAPKNTLHNFHNATDEPTTFLIELRPGSSGFEKALRVAYGLASDGLSNSKGLPKNLYHTALLFEWGEGRLPGIFALLEPVFGFLARRARRKGIDRELEERYAR
jgi:mannose-6-phosphate isomerase-like protein (cupin superfamily)